MDALLVFAEHRWYQGAQISPSASSVPADD